MKQQSRNVLLVENHQIFAKIVSCEFLQGHTVLHVLGIEQAKEAFSTRDFDIILVDYDLDDGKGSILVSFLKNQGFTGKIIGISAKEEGNHSMREAGADAVCLKSAFREIQKLF